MQINRLFEIIYILLDRKIVTADKLSERFEVSRRTIYRDIDLLSQAGIPIYTTRGKNGGIGILDNFILDKSMLSDKEQSAIITALTAMASLPNIEKTGLENKLAELFQKNNTSWISVDFSEWNFFQKDIFDKLKNSVIEKRIAELDYINSRGQKSKRTVEPLKLWFKGRTWYLIAYCRKSEDYRLFRLSRICEVTVKEEEFEREVEEYKFMENTVSIEMTEVILKISAEMEYRVYDEFRDVERDRDGNFIVKMNYHEDEWLYGYIMSFGKYARVIAPERIQKLIKKRFEESLENYL